MTNPPPPSVPPDTRLRAPRPDPTFLGALRGSWLFTWKTQLTWGRLPIFLISLLALPLLAYIVTAPTIWTGVGRQSLFSNPEMQYQNVQQRLARVGVPLRREQEGPLRSIMREENRRAEAEWQRRHPGRDEETDLVRSAFERIRSRAESVLDPPQLAELQRLSDQNLQYRRSRSTQPQWNSSTAFYRLLIELYFFIILPLNCVRLTGALIRDELQTDTLSFLLTRPMSRARLVITKFLSQTAWLQILFVIEVLLLFGVGKLRDVSSLGSVLPLLLAAQFLAVFAWSALGVLLGMLSNRYIALALFYGLVVEMGIGRIPTNVNTLSLMRHLKTFLAHNPALQTIYDWTPAAPAFPIGAIVLATGIFLTAAAFLFTVFEYHHASESQK